MKMMKILIKKGLFDVIVYGKIMCKEYRDGCHQNLFSIRVLGDMPRYDTSLD